MITLPAEWHEQRFVQLTWPHETTDWAPFLNDALCCFFKIAHEVAKRESVLIATQDPVKTLVQLQNGIDGLVHTKDRFTEAELANVFFVQIKNNDTWARDHSFISCLQGNRAILTDFTFNGWGLKFASDKDNQINHSIYKQAAGNSKISPLFTNYVYRDAQPFVLEGGSIESDGKGTLLTTQQCLLAPNRNNLGIHDIEKKLKETLGVKNILWLKSGYLEGDDTDGHIDMLARICPGDTIMYIKCDDPKDVHYSEMQKMEQELKTFRNASGQNFRLMPIPMAKPVYDNDGARLPASYANFLIINNAVLVPSYDDEETDSMALKAVKEVFPEREIVGIDCRVLIRQHGSLHCSTMQYPQI